MNESTMEGLQDFVNEHSYNRRFELLGDMEDEDLISELEERWYICVNISK